LILRKIIKTVTTKCQILRLKCTKFNFGRASAPDPAGGAYSAPPNPLAGLRGLLLRGRRGKEGEKRGGEEKGGEGERRGIAPMLLGGIDTPGDLCQLLRRVKTASRIVSYRMLSDAV